MRFFRRKNFREAVIDLGSRLLMFLIAGIFCLWMISGAKAESIHVSDIQVLNAKTNSATIEIALSGNLDSQKLEVDFQRNFVQFSIKDATIFPAKNQQIGGTLVDKIFSYQYQPDVVRSRVILKNDAAQIKAASKWEIQGNKIVLNVVGEASVQKNIAPQVLPVKVKKIALITKDNLKTNIAANDKKEASIYDADEQKTINEIISEVKTKAIAGAATALVAPTAQTTGSELPFLKQNEKKVGMNAASSEKVASAKSPMAKLFSGFLMVLLLIGSLAYGFKKFVLKKTGGIFGSTSDRMIEVVSSQMLGTKKSIAVIRVANQFMLVGITDSNINLISNLGADMNIQKYMDDSGFANILGKKMSSTDENNIYSEKPAAATQKSSFRSDIKKRLESLKPLKI